MSGTKSPSATEPATKGPPVYKNMWVLGALLWPFATSAVAINLFMLGLLTQAIGLPAISPVAALWWCLPLGLPATYAAARWVRSLIEQAS